MMFIGSYVGYQKVTLSIMCRGVARAVYVMILYVVNLYMETGLRNDIIRNYIVRKVIRVKVRSYIVHEVIRVKGCYSNIVMEFLYEDQFM